ncbi:hypothetical protein BWQ96_10557 [Gracilariopsis chorda]|uniref:Uncharacterized protein n=1 Tax=Gracilariopsis chorda TaxID=448386 RepID=A0A2V3ICC2_9FLOR|nr:hypothetical protein BWQ96_10557 [Gracilariopsis chorda]|eukprot:PXF39739.1 hypothetical protein BWQ96_10557 [Gracilariopsis chorda]
MKALVSEFEKQHRILLRNAVVETNGHVQLHTTAGSYVTSVAVIEAHLKRIEHHKRRKKGKKAKRRAAAFKVLKSDIKRLLQLALQQSICDRRYVQSRKHRLEMRQARAKAQNTEARIALLVPVARVIAPDIDGELSFGM